MMESRVFTVSSLNSFIKNQLETNDVLLSVYVKGEISNYKYHTSGHHYFSIKDPESTLRCVFFRNAAHGLRFRPENGMKVVLYGKINVYTRDGVYQLNCQEMIPDGAGELQIAFEQLKNRLNAEGLFDSRHKKALPHFPEKIAVITSQTGAAVHDIINILKNRWPLAELIIVPVTVQGLEAPAEIASAIKYVNKYALADLIITGRGGGSIEDLWAFNTETVCRAIFDSVIPVISAVGHEPDVTISDFVSDMRASTPSNAAEIAVPDIDDIKGRLSAFTSRLCFFAEKQISDFRLILLAAQRNRVFSNPDTIFQDFRLDLDKLFDALLTKTANHLTDSANILRSSEGRLKALNPLSVLARGYSVTVKDGVTVSSVSQLRNNDDIILQFSDGKAECTIKSIIYPENENG